LAKVQAYLTSLREQAEARAAARSARTVVTLTEILESLTAIARTNVGAYIRIGPSGEVEPDMDAIAAAPPGALWVRFDPARGSWSLQSCAGQALHTLFEYHFGRSAGRRGRKRTRGR